VNEKDESRLPGGRAGRALAWAVPLLLYTVLSLVYLRPVWLLGGDHLPASDEDPLFNLYVLKWAAHQIQLGLPDFWNASFFYPTRGATAYSDHLIGPAAQLVLFLQVVPNAVAGYNFLFLTGYLLSGFATFWVLRRGGLGWTAAILAGWIFAFSPFRMSQNTHIQLLLAQWIPLTLWFWDRLLAERRLKNAVLFLLFYLLNLSGGSYLAYMIHIPLIVIAINRLAVNRLGGGRWREMLSWRSLRLLLPVAAIAGAAAALAFLPYLQVARTQGLTRSNAEIWSFGSTPASYLTPEPSSLWFTARAEALMQRAAGAFWPLFFRTENQLFAGFLPTILFLIGLVAWWRRYRDREAPRLPLLKRVVLGALLLVALAGYLRATGQVLAREAPGSYPHLKVADWTVPAAAVGLGLALWFGLRRLWRAGRVLRWAEMEPWERGLALSGFACFALTHPFVYLPMMKVVPGLSGMRVPARFYFFASLSLAHFAGRGAESCLARLRDERARALFAGLFFLILAGELTCRPLDWAPVPREEDFPPVYSWLAAQRDVRALIELPITQDTQETWPMYYSTRHWKPIANGFSGYEAASHADLAESVGYLPDEHGFAKLRHYDISHLLIRAKSSRRVRLLGRWEAEFGPQGKGWVERVYTGPAILVYRLREPAPSASTPKRSGR
jgi:hypothetical protein